MKTTSILVAVAMLVAILPAIDAGPLDTPNEPERYLVGFFGFPDYRPGQSYHGNPILEVNNALKYILVETRSPAQLKGFAMLDDRVRYVQVDSTDWELHMTPNDPLHTHSALWGTHRVGASAAWDVTTGSTAIKVAHLDSGLNKNHEEFAGQARVLQGFDFRNGDNDPDDSNSCNYHGTHTTGTAGATTNNGKGIAGLSQHTILPVKIFSGGFFGCGTTTSAITNALQYAGDQGAHLSSNSWGGGASDTAINDAIKYAHGKGTIHVASAGNSGPCSNCVGQPWKDNPSITIVVSSLDDGDIFSDFSSQGPEVDIIAPGGGVGSSTSGTSDYHIMSGTSMAAPHVTGSLALYMAAHGKTDYNSVTAALASTAENMGFTADRQGDGLVRADLLAAGGSGGGGGGTETACSDGVDNDGDGLVDLNDPGCTDSADNDETDPVTGGVTLSTSTYKVKGVQHVDLTWDGATSTNVDVYRDGSVVTTTANDGFYTDNIGAKGGGSYTYKVCEAGTSTCSNDSPATF